MLPLTSASTMTGSGRAEDTVNSLSLLMCFSCFGTTVPFRCESVASVFGARRAWLSLTQRLTMSSWYLAQPILFLPGVLSVSVTAASPARARAEPPEIPVAVDGQDRAAFGADDLGPLDRREFDAVLPVTLDLLPAYDVDGRAPDVGSAPVVQHQADGCRGQPAPAHPLPRVPREAVLVLEVDRFVNRFHVLAPRGSCRRPVCLHSTVLNARRVPTQGQAGSKNTQVLDNNL